MPPFFRRLLHRLAHLFRVNGGQVVVRDDPGGDRMAVVFRCEGCGEERVTYRPYWEAEPETPGVQNPTEKKRCTT